MFSLSPRNPDRGSRVFIIASLTAAADDLDGPSYHQIRR
jgi:hypothetical protein